MDASGERKISINASKYQFRVPLKWNGFDDLKQRLHLSGLACSNGIEVKTTTKQRNETKTKHNEDIKLTNKYKIIEREWNARLPNDNKQVNNNCEGFLLFGKKKNDEDCDASTQSKPSEAYVRRMVYINMHGMRLISWRTRPATSVCVGMCARSVWSETTVWPIFVEQNIGQIMFDAYAVRPWAWWRSILQESRPRKKAWDVAVLSPWLFMFAMHWYNCCS